MIAIAPALLLLAHLASLALFAQARGKGLIVQRVASSDKLGQSVSGAGDVNNDGFNDVIVGAPYANPYGRVNAGAAYVICGKADGFKTVDLASFVSGDSAGFILHGAVAGDKLGQSVSAAGDVNNDGFADVIVGAPYADPYGRVDAGAAYVIWGKADGFKTVDLASFVSGAFTGYVIQGAAEGDRLGYSVSGAGDVNRDSHDDVIVGAPYADTANGDYRTDDADAGAAYMIWGKASGFKAVDLASFVSGDFSGYIIKGTSAGDRLGFSVSAAGDVNGDTFADVIVGAPYEDTDRGDYRTDAGAAYVCFGKASFATQPTYYTIQGTGEGGNLGWSVSGAGDVNGDGFDDVIVGAPGVCTSTRDFAGAAFVIWGKASGFSLLLSSFSSSPAGIKIEGAALYDILGTSVSAVGDVNDDGFDDVVIGAPDAFNFKGAAYVIHGKASLANLDLASFDFGESTGYMIQGATNGDHLGTSVSGAGDLDGDTYADVIVGAPGFMYGRRDVGAVYVIGSGGGGGGGSGSDSGVIIGVCTAAGVLLVLLCFYVFYAYASMRSNKSTTPYAYTEYSSPSGMELGSRRDVGVVSSGVYSDDPNVLWRDPVTLPYDPQSEPYAFGATAPPGLGAILLAHATFAYATSVGGGVLLTSDQVRVLPAVAEKQMDY